MPTKNPLFFLSFYHQAKKIRKTLIPTVLWLLLWLFIFEKLCVWYVPLKSTINKQKNFGVLEVNDEK